MKNIIALLGFCICLITSVVAQDCTLSPNVISFENSQKETLATFLQNVTVVGISTTAPAGQHSALLVLDSLGTILSVSPRNPNDCSLFYSLENSAFEDTIAHNIFEVAEISFDSLEMNLAIGQNIDSRSGCFILSNRLKVIDIKLNLLTEFANLQDNLSEEDLNIFGGGTSLNMVLNRNQQSPVNVCRIDTLNRSFGLIGTVGPLRTWVVTSREGVVLELLDRPIFDFRSYFQQVEISASAHELELFHIAYSDDSDWLVVGANYKTDLCNIPTSNRSTLYQINLIECDDLCQDGLLNGLETQVDECVMDTIVMCRISDINDVDCYGESTGSATVEVTAGVGPFSLLWETGDTTATIDSLEVGVYDVTVTDASGMTTECSAIINQPDSLTVEIRLNSIANCSASVVANGGQEPYRYLWSTGEAFISISDVDTIQSITVTDALGCTATATIDPLLLAMACGDCDDGIMNGDETAIDCGGKCDPCPDNMDTLNVNPLQLVKLAEFVDENSDGIMDEGETVNYTFSVCNAGKVPLTQIFINDPLVTVMGDTLISLDSVSCNATAFSGTYILTAEDLTMEMITNQATATARLQDSIMVSDLSDDTSVLADIDSEGDGEPDDPTVLTVILAGPCGLVFIDTDMDGTCDAEDDDDDNDGVLDVDDAFPFNATESVDTDGDGFGDNGDFDDDNDSVDDRFDAFPLDPNESIDTDEDGIGDNADLNDDGDSCDDIFDNDPLVASDMCMIDTGCDSLMVFDSSVVFSGSVMTDIGFGVDSVQMSIASVSERDTAFTDANGMYNSANLPLNQTYILRPSKEDQPFLGVTTLDMLFIQRHILRLDRLSNPYKIIAADVSGNLGISIVDIIVIRQMILGIVDEWNEGISWKFVDAEFDFFDPFVPWPFRNAKEVSNADVSRCNIDFVAIKIGDVDNSYEKDNFKHVETRETNSFKLHYKKQELKNGLFQYSFFMPEDDLLFGFQFALTELNISDVDIQSAALEISDVDYKVSGSDLRLSWTNPHGQSVNSEEVLFTLLSSHDIDLWINKTGLTPEIYIDESIERYSLDLVEDKSINLLNPKFIPNPFQYLTTLNFSLEKHQTVNLKVYDASGAIHWNTSKRLSAGQHNIEIPEDVLQQTGIYFYSIESEGQSYSGKLIKSE